MGEHSTIQVARQDGVGTVILNRPSSLNSINGQMTAELLAALKALSVDRQVWCVVLTGAGRAFSAGQDLKEIVPGLSFADLLRKGYNPLIKLITHMEKPVVAAINGIAAGAGMSLALACDFRVMSASAKLVLAFARIGLVPDSGSTYFLPRLVGLAKAFELATLGDEVLAEAALNLGLVNRVFPTERFNDETRKFVTKLSEGPTRSFALIKKSMKRSLDISLEESLDYEAYMQEIAGRTEDAQEGIKAFVEKRAPNFKGK